MATTNRKVLNGLGLSKLVSLIKNYIGIPQTLSGEDTDTLIKSGDDLDNYTMIGNYYCQTESDSANISNNPSTNAFILKIYSGSGRSVETSNGNYLTQYLEDSTGSAWRRYKTTGSWSGWGRIVVADDDTVGSGVNPVYLNNGKVTASDSTVGSGINPIYLENGILTQSTSSLGSTTKPIYLDSGVLIECTDVGTSENITVTSSIQPEREARVSNLITYDSSTSSGSGNITSTAYRFLTHTGVSAGTYTVANLLQQLTDMSHTHEFRIEKTSSNCNCNCNCDCNCDSDHDSGQ